jgi:cation/acetate symporter
MIGGLVVTIFYMAMNYMNPAFNVLGITHLGSGIFGLIVAVILCVVVSLLTAPPPKDIQELVDHMRNPITDDEGMAKYGAGASAAH